MFCRMDIPKFGLTFYLLKNIGADSSFDFYKAAMNMIVLCEHELSFLRGKYPSIIGRSYSN
jgi:hypothetical protein